MKAMFKCSFLLGLAFCTLCSVSIFAEQDFAEQSSLPRTPQTRFYVQAGTRIPLALIDAVDSSKRSGTLLARVRENIYDTGTGSNLLIPVGSRMLGIYHTQALTLTNERRILLVFDRIVRPDGSHILMNKAAVSHCDVNDHTDSDSCWARFGMGATISAILRVRTGIAGKQDESEPTIPPSLTLPIGFEFGATVNRDMVLLPYTWDRS